VTACAAYSFNFETWPRVCEWKRSNQSLSPPPSRDQPDSLSCRQLYSPRHREGMSYARNTVARLVHAHVRPRQPAAGIAQLSAFDAALEANSAAAAPFRQRAVAGAGVGVGHSHLVQKPHAPVASTSSTLPPSIKHTSLAPSSSSPSSSSTVPGGPVALPDPAARDPDTDLLAYLARLIMRDGKLARAHSALDSMLAQLHLATSSPPLPILRKAIEVVSPQIRMVGRRKGTKVMQTPQPLTDKQRTRQAWKWIVDASDKRIGDKEFDFGRRLALEVLAVLNGQSEANKSLVGRHQQGVTGRAKCVPLALCWRSEALVPMTDSFLCATVSDDRRGTRSRMYTCFRNATTHTHTQPLSLARSLRSRPETRAPRARRCLCARLGRGAGWCRGGGGKGYGGSPFFE
jgi:small subunit ribosomal protein S7